MEEAREITRENARGRGSNRVACVQEDLEEHGENVDVNKERPCKQVEEQQEHQVAYRSTSE